MHTCDGFKLILSEEDYRDSLERIETLSKLDLVGRTVSVAVRASAFKPKTTRILRTKPIPRLRIVDILRQSDFRRGNIAKGLCHIFEKYGSVVEVPIRMDGQRVVALIGAEANHWISKHGRFYLRSKDYIKDLEGAFGAARTLPGMDGPEHHKMRTSLRGAYSRAALAQRLPELIHHCKDGIGPWKEGDVFGGTETFQTYISSQVSHLTIGVDCRPYVDELLAYEPRYARSTRHAEVHAVNAQDDAREKIHRDTSGLDSLVAHTGAEGRKASRPCRRDTRASSARSAVHAGNGHGVPICRIHGRQHLSRQFAWLRRLRHG